MTTIYDKEGEQEFSKQAIGRESLTNVHQMGTKDLAKTLNIFALTINYSASKGIAYNRLIYPKK